MASSSGQNKKTRNKVVNVNSEFVSEFRDLVASNLSDRFRVEVAEHNSLAVLVHPKHQDTEYCSMYYNIHVAIVVKAEYEFMQNMNSGSSNNFRFANVASYPAKNSIVFVNKNNKKISYAYSQEGSEMERFEWGGHAYPVLEEDRMEVNQLVRSLDSYKSKKPMAGMHQTIAKAMAKCVKESPSGSTLYMNGHHFTLLNKNAGNSIAILYEYEDKKPKEKDYTLAINLDTAEVEYGKLLKERIGWQAEAMNLKNTTAMFK